MLQISHSHQKVKIPVESRIPVVKQPLSCKLVSLSQRVRSHLEHPGGLLGLLGAAPRPAAFRQPLTQPEMAATATSPSKHSSFEGDDSLGILTPDQMEDFSLLDLVEDKKEVKKDSGGCFVTSVTSLASLDNGYQGDGEWSRPASRGADHSPSAHKPPPRPDPMTDSDFFTESDAEEALRPDRRARVIDGTLYAPLAEMDSSGVYSDLDRRPEEPEIRSLSEEMEEVRVDSPESITSKSDQSLKKVSPTAFSNLIMEQVNTIKNLVTMETDSPPTCQTLQPPASKPDPKKYKTPKRTVVSKIKTMMVPTAPEPHPENRRSPKKGRWDAVMSKISQGGQPEEKCRLREVKSRVFSGLGTTASPPSAASTPPGRPSTAQPRATLSTRNLSSAQSTSTRSLRDLPLKSLKGRRCRLRSSDCSLGTPPTTTSQQSPNSSRNSSISDVSQALKSPMSIRSVKKRDTVRSGSPHSEVSSAKKPAVSATNKSKTLPGKNVPGVEKVETPRKGTPRRSASSTSVQKILSTPQRGGPLQSWSKPEKASTAVVGPTEAPPVVSKGRPSGEGPPATDAAAPDHQEAAPPSDPVPPPASALRHASNGVQAMATLVNHLVVNLDAFSTPRLKNELDRTRSDWVQAKLELEQVSSSYRRLEEELSTERIKGQEKDYQHQGEVEQLREASAALEIQLNDIQEKCLQQEEELDSLRHRYKEEVESLQNQLSSLEINHSEEVASIKRSQRAAQLELVEVKSREADLEKQLSEVQAMYDSLKQSKPVCSDAFTGLDKDSKLKATIQRNMELEAEVDSLRSVLELRCSELQELRRHSQSWQLDSEQLPQAKQTIKALHSKIETLQEKLTNKEISEQKLLKENSALNQTLSHGQVQNKRLSMQNEELTWKLKQNSKVVHALANMSADPSIYHSPEMRNARRSHKNSTTPFKAAFDDEEEDADQGRLWCEDMFSKTTFGGDMNIESNPNSPKVKAVIEKGDSVSWILGMDEPAEFVASRLLRRATSLRANKTIRPERSHSSKSLSYTTKEKEEMIVVKGNDIRFFDVDDTSEITIDDVRIRPKSDEELEMLRRVEESRAPSCTLPKDLAGEAMVSGGASDDDMLLEDDSPTRSPPPDSMDLSWSDH